MKSYFSLPQCCQFLAHGCQNWDIDLKFKMGGRNDTILTCVKFGDDPVSSLDFSFIKVKVISCPWSSKCESVGIYHSTGEFLVGQCHSFTTSLALMCNILKFNFTCLICLMELVLFIMKKWKSRWVSKIFYEKESTSF